jgi:adenylyltransferase/sulfurtransferase
MIPNNEVAFLKMDYPELCSSSLTNQEIGADTFNDLITSESIDVIDVRELHELPEVTEFKNMKIPLTLLNEHSKKINSDTIITFCQTGGRSLQAVKMLRGIFGERKKIYSLRGGILAWKKQNQTV